MLARCGATGQVVATDIDTQRIDRIVHPNFQAPHHDIVDDPSTISGSSTCSTRGASRTTSVRNVELRRCDAWSDLVAPGGRLLVEEPVGTGTADPNHPSSADYRSIATAWFRFLNGASGVDIDFGLMLPRLMVGAGLADVNNEVSGFLSTPGDLFNTWLTLRSSRHKPA